MKKKPAKPRVEEWKMKAVKNMPVCEYCGEEAVTDLTVNDQCLAAVCPNRTTHTYECFNGHTWSETV